MGEVEKYLRLSLEKYKDEKRPLVEVSDSRNKIRIAQSERVENLSNFGVQVANQRSKRR